MNKKKLHIPHISIYKLILILLAIMLIGGTVAKYVSEEKKETIYQAQSFYFKSSTLSDSSITKTFTLEKGLNTIKIDLNNFEDNLRFSDVSIDYVVSISDTNGNQVTDINENIVTEKVGNFAKKQKLTKSVEFSNLKTGTYTVTAKSVNPYTKTLKANYVITEDENNIDYTVSDVLGSSVLQLTITTTDYSGNVTISWPQGLAPDSTDIKLANANTGFSQGSCQVRFEANSEYTFQFFKQNPNTKYEKTDISVE